MYSLILAAALTQAAPAGGYSPHQYGANYGACYGVGYQGWANGGWGLPYGGYWAGYAGGGGCGGYDSVAYGMQPMTVASLPPPVPATYSGDDRDDSRRRRDDKPERDDAPDKDTPLDKGNKDDKTTDDKTSDSRGAGQGSRARLILNLPADARLYVDGQYVADAAARGAFTTPSLTAGKKYYYDLRAEVIRDGKPVQDARRVIVTAGSVIRADFSALGTPAGVAAAAAR